MDLQRRHTLEYGACPGRVGEEAAAAARCSSSSDEGE